MSIPHGAVRGISFDYGHVLGGLDLHELASRVEGRVEGAPARTATVEALRASLPAAYRAHDDAIARGLGHERAWRALMGVLVATVPSLDARARERVVDELWRAQPERNLWRFVPDDARALLDDLARAGVPMVITSNSEGRVAALLEEVGIAHHFVSILDSGVLGIAKPDARIFAQAAAALGLPIGEVVHVGDSEAADVVGAKRAGAWAVRYDGFIPNVDVTRSSEADARATEVAELRTLLFDALGVASPRRE